MDKIKDQREYHRKVPHREPSYAERWQESFMGMGLWDAKRMEVADAVFLTLQRWDMGMGLPFSIKWDYVIGGEYFPDQGNAFFCFMPEIHSEYRVAPRENRPEHSLFFRMFGIFCVKEVLFEKFTGLIKRNTETRNTETRKTETRETVSKTL